MQNVIKYRLNLWCYILYISESLKRSLDIKAHIDTRRMHYSIFKQISRHLENGKLRFNYTEHKLKLAKKLEMQFVSEEVRNKILNTCASNLQFTAI